jgi:hypothetical protein
MAKPLRSPLLGYNHNVKYKGRIYHVQTEDSGPTNPRLFTHLYFEGTILASKRHEYDSNSAEDVVRGLMQGQHKSILKDLKQATLDDKLASFFARRGEEYAIVEAVVEAAVPLAVVDTISAPIDLDALPVAIVETPPPEVTHVPLPAGGPGVYVMKKSGDGLVPDHHAGSSQAAMPQATMPMSSSDALLPVVVFDPTPSSATPPPIPRAAAMAAQPPRFPATSAHTPRPSASTGVVVQRQVVVGAGGGTPPPVNPTQRPPAPRARRPAPSIPYVVKEGSHTPPTQSRPAAIPPPRPMVPPPSTSANAPRTASVHASTPQPDLISDKSLDEVILAYLSQGDAKE